MTRRHTLLLASAGTGKTYRLAKHFESLLLAEVEPEAILATTFTRKAAREIFDRVLEFLVEAAREDERHRRRLARLARRLDRFQVRTIDSFFVHVARLFAYELALAPEWRIVDEVENRALRDEVLTRVVDGLDEDAQLELLRAVTRVGGSALAHAALARAVETAVEAHREAVVPRNGEPSPWERLAPTEGPGDDEVAAARAVIAEAEAPLTGKGKPNETWRKALDRLREALASDDDRDFLENGLVKKVLSGEGTFSSKPIDPDLAGALEAVAARFLAAERDRLLRENEATARLLDAAVAVERSLRDASGAYAFSDFPRALEAGPAGLDAETWRNDLAYRLDARVEHLLLDEFQDTAPLQWRLLLPLALEILADGTGTRSFLCVGDVKQSIYGWREAEPELLATMHERHPVLDPPETMARSRRSSDVVLDTVNGVFRDVHERECFHGKYAPLRGAAERWEEGFEDHARHPDADPLPAGAAYVLEPRVPEGGDAGEACLALAVRRVRRILAEAPGATVGVLVRSRKPIPRLLYLLRVAEIAASDEGGNPLTDAPLVAQALAVLHLADHPDDGVAALAVAGSPFGAGLGLEPAAVGTDEGRRAARRASRRVRRALLVDGLGGFLDGLRPVAREHGSDWDRRRFDQLVELAIAREADASLRPAAFARLVRETRVEDPAAARVQVMTIHAAKGLEFDAVVLPELSSNVRRGADGVLTHRPTVVDRFDVLSRVPREAVANRDAARGDEGTIPLAELYWDAGGRDLRDRLSTLYVALTRAKRRLEMIVLPPTKEGKASGNLRFDHWIREGLGAFGEPDDDGVVWRHPDGVDDWHAGIEVPSERSVEPLPDLRLAPAGAPRAGARRAPSAHGERPDAAALLARPDGRARRLGDVVHALCEDLAWIEDETRDDDALRERALRADPDRALADEAVALWKGALASDEVRAALSRASVPDGVEAEVLAERRFDVVLERTDPELAGTWGGAIDRLVLHRRDGAVVGADVLDYKTDRVEAGEAAERALVHAPQLAAYREAVRELHDLPEGTVHASVVFLRPGRVVALDPGSSAR